ncbi:MAG: pyrimidine 5'-nucleotidase [Robiginitomaculum sp.]|nr:pyrimidine 5'-nucleotidase [Robiginitomaculum sp.]
MERLKACHTWVFDLDNTLYPAQCDLFAQIDQKINRFVANFLQMEPAKARVLQKQYYFEHGTTLNGLMKNHPVNPDQFLEFVHDIDYSVLANSPRLRRAITALPGRKFVFTNGSFAHANSALGALGLDGVFDNIIDIVATGFEPKPRQSAYDHLVTTFDLEPSRSVLFEDLSRNLLPAHEMGFVTVLVCSDKDWSHEPEGARPASSDERHDHVHFSTDDLTSFLTDLCLKEAQ